MRPPAVDRDVGEGSNAATESGSAGVDESSGGGSSGSDSGDGGSGDEGGESDEDGDGLLGLDLLPSEGDDDLSGSHPDSDSVTTAAAW